MAKTTSEEKTTKKDESLVKKMLEAGVHFGHSKSRKNPRMTPYISAIRNNVNIIDLESSAKKLQEALDFIQETVKKGGVVLFVGTQPQAKQITMTAARECGMPYVVERWIGGILTNFKVVRKRVEYLKDLEKKKAAGELEKYTKKEQMLFGEEIEKLNKKFGGIKELTKLPDMLLVLSIKKSLAAVREAQRKKITIVGLADTDSDPMLADYPIPANDEAISALEFMLDKFKEIILQSQKSKVKS
jgi:small subunit ribosomal protein S2